MGTIPSGVLGKGRAMIAATTRFIFGLAFALVGVLSSQLNATEFTGKNYSITFPKGWDTVQTSGLIGLNIGLGGLATLSAVEGTKAPSIDSLAAFYADSLGGHITKGKDSALTLGIYSVHWQEFLYDSLPKLSSQVTVAAGFPVSLKNGKFRVYYLVSGGYVFSTAVMSVLPNVKLPSDAIETAIKTLKLGVQAGIREIKGAWGGTEMWVHNGRLGGAWFAAHQPKRIDCFNFRGAWIGSAQPSGSSGIWILPSVDRNAVLRMTLPDGSQVHLSVRD